MDEAVQNIKYFSVFCYFNPSDYIVHADLDVFVRDLVALGSIYAGLIVASLIFFNIKDNPI